MSNGPIRRGIDGLLGQALAQIHQETTTPQTLKADADERQCITPDERGAVLAFTVPYDPHRPIDKKAPIANLPRVGEPYPFVHQLREGYTLTCANLQPRMVDGEPGTIYVNAVYVWKHKEGKQ